MPHRVARDVALLMLRQVQRRENGGLALIGRIARTDFFELRAVFRGVDKRGPVFGHCPRGLVMPAPVIHAGMKTHINFSSSALGPHPQRSRRFAPSLRSGLAE